MTTAAVLSEATDARLIILQFTTAAPLPPAPLIRAASAAVVCNYYNRLSQRLRRKTRSVPDLQLTSVNRPSLQCACAITRDVITYCRDVIALCDYVIDLAVTAARRCFARQRPSTIGHTASLVGNGARRVLAACTECIHSCDSDVISFLVYAGWFLPPSCR